MLKSKVFQIVVAMLIVVTLILTASVLIWNLMEQKSSKEVKSTEAAEQVPAAQIKEMTYFLDEILTNLGESSRFVKAGFAFEMTTKKAKEEIEQLDFKVRGIINRTFAEMTPEQITGEKGQDHLSTVLMDKINPFLHDGKIKQVWITEMVLP
ncbi:flagellar basal body-associated protein FliL [Chlamydia abortus]|uniref:flagellar basal body-associated FliL family protein n=1 Tax=unclassified Paenibacillus TaxID=185978 RepID=UPI000A27EDD6|nr:MULTISPECIES: flagellar basal body-associated FliL family protein [Paenibacillaceae]SHE12144.1 flagellar basal body-associated protein FliL [Chlamydia abortus]